MSIAHNHKKAQKRRKKRITSAQIKKSLALFAPSPSFTPHVSRVKIIQDETRIFLLRGVRIVKQNDGSIYCQLPHQKSEKDGRFYPILCCYDKQVKQTIQNAALAAYHEAVSDPVIQLAMSLQEVQA